jgi:hypothetical protein
MELPIDITIESNNDEVKNFFNYILVWRPYCFSSASISTAFSAHDCSKAFTIITGFPTWHYLARSSTIKTGSSSASAERTFFPYLPT